MNIKNPNYDTYHFSCPYCFSDSDCCKLMKKLIKYNNGDKVGKCVFVKDISLAKPRTALFICECGKMFTNQMNSVKAGSGCGCARGNRGYIKHGHAMTGNKSPEHVAWTAMIQRCTYLGHKNYKQYGGSGIRVCDRWLGKNGFINFLSDLGNKPSPKHSLDRFPNKDGSYEPGNCRWATQKEQCRNTKKNTFITYNGETLCISEMSEKYGISAPLVRARIFRDGWPIEKALNTPAVKRNSTFTKSKSCLQ